MQTELKNEQAALPKAALSLNVPQASDSLDTKRAHDGSVINDMLYAFTRHPYNIYQKISMCRRKPLPFGLSSLPDH